MHLHPGLVCVGDIWLAQKVEQILAVRDEAANRVLSKAPPEMRKAACLGDRVELMREMFRT